MKCQITLFSAGILCLSAVLSQDLSTSSLIGIPLSGGETTLSAGDLATDVPPVSPKRRGGAHTFEGRQHPENHSEEIHNHTHAFENGTVSPKPLKHFENRSDDSLIDQHDHEGSRFESKGKHESFLPSQPKRPKREGFEPRQAANTSHPPPSHPEGTMKPENSSIPPPKVAFNSSIPPPPGAQGKPKYPPASDGFLLSTLSRRPKRAGFVPPVPSHPSPFYSNGSRKPENSSNPPPKSGEPHSSNPPPSIPPRSNKHPSTFGTSK